MKLLIILHKQGLLVLMIYISMQRVN